ncbi:hypothetical protein K502DRAFT_344953 [Neoconidiobolus thromboides FSU 785]|nr:hypothetical protein K502DRAFT_344953 [Neoconidiobolus thromboides FSU 785]
MNFKFTIALALLDLVASASVCPTAKTLAKDMEGLYRQDKTGVTEVIFGFYHQMQLDGNGNYYIYKDFYCPEGTHCPIPFAPTYPTKGKYQVSNVSCAGQETSFQMTLTEYVNTLNMPVDANNRLVKQLKVTMKDDKLVINDNDNKKSIIRVNDHCDSSIPSFAPCSVSTGIKGTDCYGKRCKIVEKIEF